MKVLFLVTVAVSAIVAFDGAGAQSLTLTESQPQPTSSNATPMPGAAQTQAPAQTSATETGIADIIVTASRREQSLQRTPIPVTAVTGDSLRAQGIVQPQDLSKAVAGLAISPAGASSQIYLRGVGTFAIGPFAESTVAFNVDDVFMSLPQFASGQFYDLQRVEVLKGPQGTLYGRNATAGAINLISVRPSFTLNGNASVELGDYGQRRFNAALNVPLGDTFAVRGAFQYSRHNGYSSDGYDDDDTKSGRIQALFKPNNRFSILVAADFVHVDQQGNGTHPLDPTADHARPPGGGDPWEGQSTPRSNQYLALANATPPYAIFGVMLPLLDNRGYIDSKVWGVRSEIKADLDFATLTVIPSYRKLTFRGLDEPGFLVTTVQDASQKSVEGRLASNGGGPFSWLIGGFYLRNSNDSNAVTVQGVSMNNQSPSQRLRSAAAFGQATYRLSEDFRLTGGLRYTNEKRTQFGGGTQFNYFPPPAFPFAPMVASYSIPGEVKNQNVSYKAGVEYDAAPRSLLYATVSTGFKSGGLNADVNNAYRPEKLTAYTIGSKNRFLDGKLQANAELFYWDYRDHQENVLTAQNVGGFAPQLRNIQGATTKGISLDIVFQPTPADVFTVQGEYLAAKFDDFVLATAVAPSATTSGCAITVLPPAGPGAPPPGIINCSGRPFTRAPKVSGTVGYQHSFTIGEGKIVAGASAQFSTSYYIATDYLPQEKQRGFGLIDLSLAYEAASGQWSVAGYVRNLTDHAVYNGGFEQPFVPGLVYATLRPPRTFSVVLSVNY